MWIKLERGRGERNTMSGRFACEAIGKISTGSFQENFSLRITIFFKNSGRDTSYWIHWRAKEGLMITQKYLPCILNMIVWEAWAFRQINWSCIKSQLTTTPGKPSLDNEVRGSDCEIRGMIRRMTLSLRLCDLTLLNKGKTETLKQKFPSEITG